MQKTIAALAISAAAFGATFDIDPAHSSAAFQVKHMMISNVKGSFSKVTGTVEFDPKNAKTAKIDATIDASTINTQEPKRDGHLKSPDFFDVAKFPTITFRSSSVTPSGSNKFKAEGDLTIHGVTKKVTLDVETTPEVKDPWGNTRIGASAKTRVNRKDFGLVWNQALDGGGVLIADDVDISLEVELVKKKDAKATD